MTQRTNQFKALHRNAMERAMQIDEAGGGEEGGEEGVGGEEGGAASRGGQNPHDDAPPTLPTTVILIPHMYDIELIMLWRLILVVWGQKTPVALSLQWVFSLPMEPEASSVRSSNALSLLYKDLYSVCFIPTTHISATATDTINYNFTSVLDQVDLLYFSCKK